MCEPRMVSSIAGRVRMGRGRGWRRLYGYGRMAGSFRIVATPEEA